MKVAILPQITDRNNGVAAVVWALLHELPRHGVDIVTAEEADVVHCHALGQHPRMNVYTNHGVMPIFNQAPINKQANEVIKDNIRRATVVTTVAQWNQRVLSNWRTDIWHIPNGIFLEEWKPARPGEYILWSKMATRGTVTEEGFVVARWLAQQTPKISYKFVSSIGETPPNVEVVGYQKFSQMKELVRHANVLLATTWECMPINILEAMASGVPIVGMNYPGVAEVVGEGGILVDDYRQLPNALQEVLANRKHYSKIARDIAANFQWKNIVPQYIKAYEAAPHQTVQETCTVSIIITCRNLERYIKEAIDSALAQEFDSFEVIVVDDGSSDGSWDIIRSYGKRIKAYRIPGTGHGGAGYARNYGIERARGKFIVCLDGDDILLPQYLATLVPLLEKDDDVGIAASGFEAFGAAQGTFQQRPVSFEDLVKSNRIGCASLFRRRAWQQIGGYKWTIRPSWEDYDLWLSIAELGYKIATVPQILWRYRVKGVEGQTYLAQDKEKMLRAVVNAHHPLIYRPLVSIIIPCYNQEQYLPQAIDSVLQQTVQDFEIIVVDDGSPGDVLKALEPYANDPRIRLVRQENKGLPAARNSGIRLARANYILPLDADDYIAPTFLEKTLALMRKNEGIIYTDAILVFPDGKQDKLCLKDFDFALLLKGGIMLASSLYPKKMWRQAGGYPEDMKLGWEDYAFWVAACSLGWKGYHLSEPLFYYRQREHSMRLEAKEQAPQIRHQLWKKFGHIYRRFGWVEESVQKGVYP